MRRLLPVSPVRAAAIAAMFAVSVLLLFTLLAWQTTGFETERADQSLRNEALAVSREPPASVPQDIAIRYRKDLHRITGEALFARNGQRLAGDLAAIPAGVRLGAPPEKAVILHQTDAGMVQETVRIVARTLSDGSVFLVWRSLDQINAVNRVVLRGLLLGLMPGLALAVIAGYFAASRASARVAAMHHAIETIRHGSLQTRLPVLNPHDELGMLATSVNTMLQELEHLVGEIRAAGDGMAHDLRTPLARARARLETGRLRASALAELATTVDAAIGDLDQCATVITALLRIGEIEGSARKAGFGPVDPALLLTELGELYQPVAEARCVQLSAQAPSAISPPLEADRDLLFEAMANLVDNAVKFTPEGGRVSLAIEHRPEGPVLWVKDTGPGIAEGEREAVLQRFHRGDKARSVPGAGLGLSLVAAIVRLHGFRLLLETENGLRAGIWCLAGDFPPASGGVTL